MAANDHVKINVRCTRRERDRFQRAAAKEGTSSSDVLRRMMLDYAKGRISYPVQQEVR